jgi:diacylglycerol kinase family enzyme
VTNSISVAGSKLIAGKGVELNDGLFEVVLVKNPENPLVLAQMLTEIFQENPENNNYIIRFKTRHIQFEVSEKIDWVLDGEFGGCLSKVEIDVKEKALNLIRKK